MMAQVTETTDERCDDCGREIGFEEESVLGILMKPEGETTIAEVCDWNCWDGLLAKGWRELSDEEMEILRQKVNHSILGPQIRQPKAEWEIELAKQEEEGRA